MPVAWFFCPYKRRNPGEVPPERYCAMDDFTTAIFADGGNWSETEIQGNHAIVKVRAANATLTNINAANGFVRIPNHTALNATLGDLTTNQKNALKTFLNSIGYTNQEIADTLPANWTNVTLRQVLQFAATRRHKPRYDADTDSIILDGAVQPVRPLDHVNGDVT